MKYKVVSDNNQYQVYEVETDQIIKVFDKYNLARKLSTFLNQGGGFDGQTPSFFVKNYNIINTAQ